MTNLNMDNTAGYTQGQLDEMNTQIEDQTKDLNPDDVSYKSEVDQISERVLANCEVITVIKITSCEPGDCEEVIIKTEGMDEQHEWIMQTTKGKFDTSLGCLEFMNGDEFDRDDLTEIEELHYDTANDCFNENAPKFYEEKTEKEFDTADKYFYAESSDECGCDLNRYLNQNERNEFIDSVNNANNDAKANELSTTEAMEQHKDQFNHWGD